jgi:threonine aldolase
VARPRVDLVSDTATRPTPAMRRAIAEAEVGDDQKGEDPTVNRLQDRVAELLGTEAALFLVSGTMCNNVAVAALTGRGDAVVVDRRSHILRSEAGGAVVGSGVVLDQIDGERGHFTPEQLAAAMHPGSLHVPPTRLVSLEQTHNFAGGTVWPLEQYRAVCAVARDHGAAVHVDGARLPNAVVASGVPFEAWAEPVDSIWIDFTKGLGAPIGAVLAGRADFIARARRYKHVFGAAMRQAGIAAAGGLHALDHHVERLADDHRRAARLAEGLVELGCRVDPVETNMVFFDPQVDPAAFVAGLGAAGVRLGAVDGRIRAVTHLDVDDGGIEAALEAAKEVLAG